MRFGFNKQDILQISRNKGGAKMILCLADNIFFKYEEQDHEIFHIFVKLYHNITIH